MSTGERERILGIAGSPRRRGNSARLLDECLAAADSEGVAVERIFLAEYAIAPCTGCGACSRSGTCVIDDDARALGEKLEAAGAVVVASPVYFAGVPAGLKAFYDRLQPYWARRYVLGEPAPLYRPAALLLSRGGGDPFGYECAVTVTRSALGVVGIRVEEVVVAEGPDAVGDIERYPEALENACRAGTSLARAVRSGE